MLFSKVPGRKDTIAISGIPACLVEREASELKRGRQSVAWDIVEVNKTFWSIDPLWCIVDYQRILDTFNSEPYSKDFLQIMFSVSLG